MKVVIAGKGMPNGADVVDLLEECVKEIDAQVQAMSGFNVAVTHLGEPDIEILLHMLRMGGFKNVKRHTITKYEDLFAYVTGKGVKVTELFWNITMEDE